MASTADPAELYSQFGGTAFFDALVGEFYSRVAADELLRPMYPAELAPAERRLLLFLMQYWGGPKTYNEERGHPRLRMRHAPYPIDEIARDRWLLHMANALEETCEQHPVDENLKEALWRYLVNTADAMVNQPRWIAGLG
jgi:hemoglobin